MLNSGFGCRERRRWEVADRQLLLGRRIRNARDRLGLTQQELAKRAGFSAHQIVSNIEKGQRDLKAWELKRIAQTLHMSMMELLQEVEKPSPRVLWREEPPKRRKEIEAVFLERCRQYRQVEILAGMESITALPAVSVDGYSASYWQIGRIASGLHGQFDLGARPASSLAKVLEGSYGVKIWHKDLGDRGSAASVKHDFGPAVLINSREAPWRRNFSLAHELFHLITWDAIPTEQIEEDSSLKERVEILAGVFASNLLLPADRLLAEYEKQVVSGEIDNMSLIRIAREFDVSTDALLWRLVNLHRVAKEDAEAALGDETFRELDRVTMAENWWSPPPIPERFVRLAFVAFQRGRLSRARLAELLDTSLPDLTDTLLEYGFDDREDYETTIGTA